MPSNPKLINVLLSDDAYDYFKHLRSQKVSVSSLISYILRSLGDEDPSYTPSKDACRPEVYGAVSRLLSKIKHSV